MSARAGGGGGARSAVRAPGSWPCSRPSVVRLRCISFIYRAGAGARAAGGPA